MYKTICNSIIFKTPLIQPPHCYILQGCIWTDHVNIKNIHLH